MVHFYIKTQNLELVNVKCVTYAQPIPLSLIEKVTLKGAFNNRCITKWVHKDWLKRVFSTDYKSSALLVGVIDHNIWEENCRGNRNEPCD